MNHLKRLAEFKKVLANYHISDSNKKILTDVKFVLLLAPTSSGRNTIIRELIKTGDYHYVVSDTTRQPRVNDGIPEQNGVEYWFRNESEVLNDLKAGKYLEAEIIHSQQVSATSLKELAAARQQNRIAITDIDLQGAKNIVEVKPDTTIILVLPPSFKEWQRRFRARGQTAPVEYRRRMETAYKIFESALKHPDYKFVINDTVADATKQIQKIAQSGKVDPKLQLRGRQLAQQLYEQTRDLLTRL